MRPIVKRKLTKNDGKFINSKSDTIMCEYTMNSNEGFYLSIDFELKEGRVNWELLDPKGTVAFKGYVVNEAGKTYRELTYPTDYLKGAYKAKEEVTNKPDFNYLGFEYNNLVGDYKLNLNPVNAAGNYEVVWSDSLPQK
jgi:hypothetical protein